MLAWGGDPYGSTVNLASRLVGIARPGTVLVSDDIGQQLTADANFTLRAMKDVRLKGIGRTTVWGLRRSVAGEPTNKEMRRERAEKTAQEP